MNTTENRRPPEYLIDLVRRAPLLKELQEGAYDRRELQDRLKISRATSHRHTRLLGELGLIEKVSGKFRLTESGKLLANALVRFERDAQVALQLAPLLEAIQPTLEQLDVEAFADATVTNADRGDPYKPMARFIALVQETETLRGFDMDLIAPFYIAEIHQRIVGGLETEEIALPDVVEDTIEHYPDTCAAACASGNLTVWLHDDLPFGLAIFDECVGIGVFDEDSRTVRQFVDTPSAAVHKWANAVYKSYKEEAVYLDEYTHRGFRRVIEQQAPPP